MHCVGITPIECSIRRSSGLAAPVPPGNEDAANTSSQIHLNRRYALVTVKHVRHVKKAIRKLNEFELDGHKLVVGHSLSQYGR